jgi:uncharacterized protein (TIGR02466 family)
MIKHNLFPTPVGAFHLDSDLTADELSFIKNLTVRPSQRNMTSVDTDLFEKPELSRIAEFCNRSLKEYFQTIYAPKSDVSPYITHTWANFTHKGQSHHKHEHPNSVVSGVFYVQTVKDLDRLYFFKPGYQQIKITPTEYNLENAESWWLGVKTGLLFLFPSSLSHQVDIVLTDEPRISLSFNTFLKGQLGDEIELTSLHI